MGAAKLLVLTDIHIVEHGADIIGLDPAARFQEVLEHALAHHGDAERLVITGDLTHHGKIIQYERLQTILAGIEMPVTLMLGNHDKREAFHEVFNGDGFVQGRFEIGGATCLYLDTLDGPPYPKGHHAGMLCDDRLAWLDAQLAETSRPVLLFMHHPPFDTGFDGMDGIKLANADAFYEVISRHGNVAHLTCGHVHRTISGTHRGLPFSIFKSPCHQMPMLLGKEGTAYSVDEPGAYGIVLIDGDSVVVHSEDVGLGAAVIHDPTSN